MYRIIFILSLVLLASSCKKNQENVLSKELSESIHMLSSNLNTLIFSHALVDKFSSKDMYDIEDCFNFQSDTLAGNVTHTLHFEKENFCDFYHDSTSGVIRVRFEGDYGSIMDTISIHYENFKSNGYTFNGVVKAVFLSNVNFTTSIQKIVFTNLDLNYKGVDYQLTGSFSSYYSQENYKTSGELSSTFFGQNVSIEIVEDLEHLGNYTTALHTPYLLKGNANFQLGKEKYGVFYGVNSQNYLDYSKAICIDSTGYRYILPLSKL